MQLHSRKPARSFTILAASLLLLLGQGLILNACGDVTPTPIATISTVPAGATATSGTNTTPVPNSPTAIPGTNPPANSPTVAPKTTTVAPKGERGILTNLFPALQNLADATTIRFRDDWSSFSFRQNVYLMQRNGNQFEGEAVFQSGGPATTREIIVPLATAQDFLRMLAQSQVEEGDYKPTITHTDDYPHLSIQIEGSFGLITIYSDSQGDDHVPWGVKYAGRGFILNSDLPSKALAKLALPGDSKKPGVNPVTPSPVPTSVPTSTKPSALKQTYSILTQPGHTDRINKLVFNGDGNLFATGGAGRDPSVRLWETATGKLLKIFRGANDEVNALAFSPDGKLLAAGSYDFTIRLWEIETGRLVTSFRQADRYVSGVTFTADSKFLISGGDSRGRVTTVWQVDNGKAVFSVPNAVMALHPGGKTMAVALSDELRLVDLSNGSTISSVKEKSAAIPWLVISPDGNTLASGRGNEVILREAATLNPLGSFTFQGREIQGFAFSPNSKILAVGRPAAGSLDIAISLRDVATNQEITTVTAPKGNYLRNFAFSPDSKMLATSDFSSLSLWEIPTGKKLDLLAGPQEFVFAAAFSPDGKTLAGIGANQEIKLWRLASAPISGGIVPTTLSGAAITSLALSKDGKILATGTDKGEIRLWNAADGKALATLKGGTVPINALAFSPDGKQLAAGSGRAGYDLFNLKLWDVTTGKELLTLTSNESITGHTGAIQSVAFSPDGKMLASGSSDRTAMLWEISSGKKLATLKGKVPDFYEVFALAFSPDGKTLATGGGGDSAAKQYAIKLWDVTTGRELAQSNLKGHTKSLFSLAFSPDGKTLASAGDDNFIKLWDAATGTEQATLTGYLDKTNTLAFSPDGKILAGAHNNGAINLWDIATRTEISNTSAQELRGLAFVAFAPDGKTLFSAHPDSSIRRWEITL